MYDVYWGCLVAGIGFGLVSLLFGDGIGDAFDGILDGIGLDSLDFLHPMSIMSAVTLFGGTGIMLTDYSSLGTTPAIVVSAVAGVVVAVLSFFVYVKPMKNTESSLSFSIKELVGRSAEVTIPIPNKGHGQVAVKMGSQTTYQIADSYSGEPIPAETKVLVISEGDGVLTVEVHEG